MHKYTFYQFNEYKLILIANDKGLTYLNLFEDDDLTNLEYNPLFMAPYTKLMNDFLSGIKPDESYFDINYTPFQKLVWDAVSNIPYGTTISYQDLAIMLNKPNASRAVGSALGKNPLLILIPCHRAIRKNGTIGGYKTSELLKQTLIQQEKENTPRR